MAGLLVLGVAAAFLLRNRPQDDPAPVAKEEDPKQKPARPPLNPNAAIEAADVRRVKDATVYLRVHFPNDAVLEGTGFFAVQPGVILTNAHVVGMRERDGQPPTGIDAVLHGGESRERTVAAKLIAVDRRTDLAVLRLEDPDGELPAPLAVAGADSLVELQKVYIFGFPFGRKLGKNITITESSVSSLRRDSEGMCREIQVNGGMHPGNSGGPVVDARGDVAGVAVAILRGTSLHFAVPGEFVHLLLDGCLLGKTLGEPIEESGKVRLPLTLEFFDPLHRLREVKLVVWTGELAAPRPDSFRPPTFRKDDGPRQEIVVSHKENRAEIIVDLPPLPRDHVYWVQPVVVNGSGRTRWMAVEPWEPAGPPLQRRAENLRLVGSPTWKTRLTTLTTLYLRDDPDPLRIRMEIEMEETTPSGGPCGLFLAPGKLSVDELPVRRDMAEAWSALKGARIAWRLGADGLPDPGKLPSLPRLPSRATRLLDQVLRSFALANLPLPGKEIQPLETWSYTLPLRKSLLHLTARYEGSRNRDSQREAFVSLRGRLVGRDSKETQIGTVEGKAFLDLDSGRPLEMNLRLSAQGDGLSADESEAEAVEIRLERRPLPAPSP